MAISWVKTSLGDLNLGNSSGSLQHNHAAWNGSVCVLVGNNGSGGGNNTSYSSSDFDTWMPHAMPASLDWRAVAWNGTVFCAVGSSSSTAATSPDGITWTSRTLPSFDARSCIAWNGTYFVTLSFTSSGTKAARSTDGISWSEVTIPFGSWNSTLAAYNGLFCTIDQNGSEAHTSPDGATWTSHTLSPSLGPTYFLIAGPDGFYAVTGSSSPSLYSSVDGVTWALRRSFGSGFARGFTWTGQYFVFSQETAPPRILYSQDTESWYEGEPFSYSADLLSPAVVSGSLVLFFDFGTGGVVDLFEVSMTPPPPPNNSAPIEFEPLVSSPETLAEDLTSLALPRIEAFGAEAFGGYGFPSLPALSVVASGVPQDNVTGSGVASLPPLAAFGDNASVGLVVDYTARAVAMLPALTAYGRDASGLVPEAGWGSLTLPAFSAEGAGGECLFASVELALPPLQAFAYDVSGGYGVAPLPPLDAVGHEVFAVPENRMLLVQPAGAMALMAGNTYTVLRDENVAFEGDSIAAAINVLREQIAANAAPNPMLSAKTVLSDDAAFYDALAVAWKLLLQEEVALVGAASASPLRLASVVDTLHATGTVSPRTDAVVVVASAVALNSLLASGWTMEAADTVAFQDALANAVRVATQLVESAGFADTTTPQVRMTAVVTDVAALDGTPDVSLEALATLADGVLFHAVLRFGDDEYVGWVLNEGAPSQYTNYPFNGLSAFGRSYVGTANDGIYLLEGEDDAGEPIEAHIKTALMDFGAGVNKRLPDVYVAFAGGNKLVCKVVTSHPRSGQKVESVYESTLPPGSEMHNGRIKLGQGLESRYWQFTLANVDGADFDIDELTFRPLFLDRRL